jgi:hypothetical protein
MPDTQRKAARDKAREIMRRMQTDAGFVEQLRRDPHGTLAAAGMPADVLDEAADGLGLGPEDEAAGHLRNPTRYGGSKAKSIWAAALAEEADVKAQ